MQSDDHASISVWVCGLKDGDADAAQELWNRFFDRLVLLAKSRIRESPKGTIDAEDIAASVFESLWRGSQEGRFADVRNRDELWWLLLAMTKRKAASHIRRESAQKRGGGTRLKSLSNDGSSGYTFEDLVSQEMSSESLLIFEEEYSRLLSLLRDDRLRQIAVLKVGGYVSREIAERLGVAVSTVTRKLRLIRSVWARELGP